MSTTSTPIETIQKVETDEQGQKTYTDVYVKTHGDAVIFNDGQTVTEKINEIHDTMVDNTVTINGQSLKGSINITAADVGAATADHTHTPASIGADVAGAAADVQVNLDTANVTISELAAKSLSGVIELPSNEEDAIDLDDINQGIWIFKVPEGSGFYKYKYSSTIYETNEVTNDVLVISSANGNANYKSIIFFNINGEIYYYGRGSRYYSFDIFPMCGYVDQETSAVKNSLTSLISNCIKYTDKNIPGGVAGLDINGLIPSELLPSYVDDVLEYPSKNDFPTTGDSGKIYVDTSTNLSYRWGGTMYVEISSSLALGETSTTAYPGDKGKATADTVATLHDSAFSGDADTVNGHTVSADVPADAVFYPDRTQIDLGSTSSTALKAETLYDGTYEIRTAGYIKFDSVRTLPKGTQLNIYTYNNIKHATLLYFYISHGLIEYKYNSDTSQWTFCNYITDDDFESLYSSKSGITPFDMTGLVFARTMANGMYTVTHYVNCTFSVAGNKIPVEVGDYVFKDDSNILVITKQGIYSYTSTDGFSTAKGGKHLPESDIDDKIDAVWEKIYPVGSVYISMSQSFNPNTAFGGTWERTLQGKMLIGTGTSQDAEGNINTIAIGETGGTSKHILTVNEMPSHNHVEGGWAVATGSSQGGMFTKMSPNPNEFDNWDEGTKNTGGGQAHTNMPPYMGVAIWQRLA